MRVAEGRDPVVPDGPHARGRGGGPAQEGHLHAAQVREGAAAVLQGLPHEVGEAHEEQDARDRQLLLHRYPTLIFDTRAEST